MTNPKLRMFTRIAAKIMGDTSLEALDNNCCPWCKKPVVITDFRDSKSLREYGISGVCQACQDGFFGVEEPS